MSIYDFEITDISGSDKIELSEYRGNVILAVNTASKCGYTSQYEQLQNLHEKYKDKGLVVIGFPSGDFGGQEFETNEEIQEFCDINFGVDFPLSTKVSVKGENQHQLFKYLTNADNPDFTGNINWNFEKFLISPEGELVRRFNTKMPPDSEEVLKEIESLLPS